MRVILLVGGDRGRFPASNCLLVRGARGTILVDAGCNRDQVLEASRKADLVVYTHVHPDHITHHRILAGTPARIPAADAPFTTLHELGKRYAPEIAGDWVNYARTVFNLDSPPRGEPYEPWDEVRAGDASIVMIPARGHTMGHHYVLAGSHLHISDVDLTRFGPWYGHPESSITGFLADMRAALDIGAKKITTSHREREFTAGELPAEMEKYLQSLCRQVGSVHNALSPDRPVRPADLAGKGLIYRRYIPGMETVMRYFETQMITKILELLATEGGVAVTSQGYIRRPGLPRVCERLRDTISLQ